MSSVDTRVRSMDHSRRTTVSDGSLEWTSACALRQLIPGLGVAVLLRNGEQVALFLTEDGNLYAVGNIDPFGHAAVMSRGLVGDRAGEPTVASPLLKQVFSLVDGRCLDDDEVRLPVYDVRVWGGVVQVHSSAGWRAARSAAQGLLSCKSA